MLFSLKRNLFNAMIASAAVLGVTFGAVSVANAGAPQKFADARKTYNVPLPDLVLTQFSAVGAQSVKDGKVVIPVQIIVKNQGTATAKGKFAVGVKRLAKWKWSTLVESIEPGKSRIINGEVHLSGLTKGRKAKLTAMADAPIAGGDTSIPKTGRVQELNEANNTKFLSVRVTVSP